MGQIMEFYQEFAAFQSLSNKDVVKYATKSLFYKFPSNTVVVREGDFPEEIFFLKSGRVKIVKRLNFKINPVTKALQYDDPSEPTQEDIERGHYKSMLIEIDELSPGDSFCDASILNKEPMHHTVICSMPCELIALPHYDLKTMSASLLEEYQTLCKTYPDNSDLRKAYLDRTKWDSWKKNLYQNIQIDKTNRRRGFDQQLRGPFIKRIQLEKLTIPLETDIKTNLLNMINQTVQTARVGTHSKLIESPNPTYNNLSRIKTGQDGSISKRKATVPLLPKINNINTTAKDLSSFRNGSYSHRDYSTMSANKLKFDFVVPKHRLANYEEKEVTTKGNEGEVINYNEGNVINTELTDEKARALVNFNFEELPPLTASDEDLEEDEKKSGADEDSSSVLGTRNIESTFTKVMSTMNLEMPTLKKKYKIKGSTLL